MPRRGRLKYQDIEVTATKPSDLPDLWEIVRGFPSYFDDHATITSYALFSEWFKANVKASLTAFKDDEIIGCSYVDVLKRRVGRINIFTKRHSMTPATSQGMMAHCLPYFFETLDVGMLYGTVHVRNRACIRLLKHLGFKMDTVLKNYEIIDGKLTDCFLATKMREAI